MRRSLRKHSPRSIRARGEALESRNLLSFTPLLSEIAPEITTTNSDQPVFLPRQYLPEDKPGTGGGPQELNASGPLINLDDFRNDPRFAGIDGGGYSVAILDTGIDRNHPHFGPDSDSNGIADRIVYNWDFGDNDNDASDVNGHGSNVAGIALSQDATYKGMAPGANIIALKVFANSGAGNFGQIEQALQWVVANRVTYNIVSLNMSLGDGGNYNTNRALYGISDEMSTLAANNVIVASSAGNDFWEYGSAQGVGYPAADANSLAVSAVFDANVGGINWGGPIDNTSAADRIVSFSQRSTTQTDIFAPGATIRAANQAGGTTIISGTSQASPHITGVVALMQDLAMVRINRRLTFAEVRSILQTNGVVINDGDDENDNVTNTGANFKRVDVLAVGNAIWNMGTGGTNNPPVLAAIGNKNVNETGTLTFTASATDPDSGQTISYTLGPGAPSGASINLTSGAFSWTPADNQAVDIQIIATDSGTPAGSDSETITVTVNNLPPTASVAADYVINEGGTVSLSGSGTDPAGAADPLTYSWDINGDGTFGDATGSTPFVTWPQLNAIGITGGPFSTGNLRLRVNDGDGGITDSASRLFTVNNVAPNGTVTPPSPVAEGGSLVLSGSGSDVNPLDVLTFTWDVNGDGNFSDASGTNPTLNWAQLQALGINDGLLVIGNAAMRTSDGVDTDTDLFTVIVFNVAPSVSIASDYTISEGGSLTLTANGSDPAAALDPLSYSWDINGDGTFGDAAGASPSLTWGQLNALGITDGPFTTSNLRVRADDGDGGVTDSAARILTVNNAAPTVSIDADYTIPEGGSLAVSATASDPAGAADPLAYSWDINGDSTFGDASGASPSLTWGQLNALGINDGPFSTANLRVRVTDGDGGSTDSAARVFTVDNVAPTASAGGPYTINQGDPLALSGSGTDPSLSDSLTFSWDVNGDGNFTDVSGMTPTLTPGQLASLGITAPNIYNVRVRVDDGDSGITDSAITTLTVNQVAFQPPRIGGVSISGSGSVHATYSVPTGSGEQLRTIPVGGLDSVSIAFNLGVNIAQGDLTVTGTNVASYPVTGFSYDSINFIATWTLGQVVDNDRITLTLPDTVTGTGGGVALDGGWTNPANLNDTGGSSFPSGDGMAGGAFAFRVHVLPGDANRDNVVTGADFTIWGDGFGEFAGNATFTDGDFNGDGFVTGGDFTLWADNFGIDQITAPSSLGIVRGAATATARAAATDAALSGAALSGDDEPLLAPVRSQVTHTEVAAIAESRVTRATTNIARRGTATDRVLQGDTSWLGQRLAYQYAKVHA